MRVLKDSTGVTLIAFDSIQVNYLIQDLKEVGWNKKQIKSLEKQIRNLNWKIRKQGQIIDSLEKQVETYISISFNYKKQVEVKQKEIEELEGNIEDYKLIEDNLTTIKDEYKKKIKSLRQQKWILIGTNTLTAILLILSLTSN